MEDRSKGPVKEKPNLIVAKMGTRHGLVGESYVNPKPKISMEEVYTFRKSLRIILSCQQVGDLEDIPIHVRVNFHVDLI